MYNVTNRVKEFHQPRGGFVSPDSMKMIPFDMYNRKILTDEENIHPSIVGIAVDYLTRFVMTGDKTEAFKISMWGARCAYEAGNKSALTEAGYLYNNINKLDDSSILSAIKLVTFDVWYRCPFRAKQSKPAAATLPNAATIYDVHAMVVRSLMFFHMYGPVIADGFTFEPEGLGSAYENWKWNGISDFGGYTRTVSGGDGDFLTEDVLWDFKVSKSKPTKEHTLQLLMYWIMGKHSGQAVFKNINSIGIFNPRRNEIYVLNVNDIPGDVIKTVESEVLVYDNPIF